LPEQANGAAEDPWGINAWIARQPNIEVKPDATGIPGACLNGWMVVSAAKDIADKAGPATVLAGQLGRHGGLDARRAGDRRRRRAARHRRPSQAHESIRSIAVFDGTVRAVLLRSAGRVLAMCATARVEAGWRATEPAC
jgi:hypothetical protein